MKRPRIKRPKATRPRPKVYPDTPPADAPPPKPATPVPNTGWMGPGFDDGMAAAQNAQQRARFIAATSGGASPPFPPLGFPPFTAGEPTPPPKTTVIASPQEQPPLSAGTSVTRGPIIEDLPRIDSIPQQVPPTNSAHTPPTTPVEASAAGAIEFGAPILLPNQSLAPVIVEERDGKIALRSERDSPLQSSDVDFNAWREPIIDHIRELLARDFPTGTNHGRARDRLVALDNLLPGDIPGVKERQFRIGYEIERLAGLVAAYKSSADDMPALNGAVLEDLNRLLVALQIGIDKLERWAEFRGMAAEDPQREGEADPTVVGDALDEMAAKMVQQAKYFDPEVPATFRFLAESVRDPYGATKTVVYGAVRTAQNVICYLGRKALGIATKAIDAVEDHISKGVATFLLTSLSAAALKLNGVLPTSWEWLKPLLELLGLH